jgi:D-tyrosyl-tRNA(Tyr) deacylase
MRAVIQRVRSASVSIHGEVRSSIGPGLLVLLGVETTDLAEDAEWLSGKISRLRVFHDSQGIMNLSLQDTGGEVLVISQFTLHASTKKGNRPSYIRAARPETAVPLYKEFIRRLETETGTRVKSGEFGAYMQVELINDGPVTIIIDSKNRE